ncbi:MAG: hypothetical protein ACI9WU_004143, partial [Myxococcota bacterium]
MSHRLRLVMGCLLAGLAGLAAGCGATMSIEAARSGALASLEDPAARDAALDTLAGLALAHDGDPAKAELWLSERSTPPTGRTAIVAGLAAESRGDLEAEIAAWQRALTPADANPARGANTRAAAVAIGRLLAIADYIPVARRPALLAALDPVGSELAAPTHALRQILGQEQPAIPPVQLASVVEHWPLSAFVDGRGVPEEAPSKVVMAPDGEVRLANVSPVLARIQLQAPASGLGQWLMVGTGFHVRIVGGNQQWVDDPRSATPAGLRQVWLPPSKVETPISIELAVTAPHARVRLGLVEGKRGTTLTASNDPVWGWLGWLARTELASWRGDRDAVVQAARHARAASPTLMAARLLEAGVAEPERVRDVLGNGAIRHVGAVRLLVRHALSADRDAEKTRLLAALESSEDPRSALARFRLFQDRGWAREAAGALDHARNRAPDACGPAREYLQFHWARLKLRGVDPARDLLPEHCARLPELQPVLAHYAAEVGRVAEALARLEKLAQSSGETTLHAASRVRYLERMGQAEESRRLAAELAEKGEPGVGARVEPWFRVGDLEASAGRRSRASIAWKRAAAEGAGDLDARLKLLAVG